METNTLFGRTFLLEWEEKWCTAYKVDPKSAWRFQWYGCREREEKKEKDARKGGQVKEERV